MTWQSVLEKHPDYLRAIGMISIEQANLDIMLSELLSIILNVPLDVGQALYLTPNSAMARIQILENVAKVAFPTYPTTDVDDDILQITVETNTARTRDRKRVEAILKRAKAIVGKRHQTIHEVWGLDKETLAVKRRAVPTRTDTGQTLVPLQNLTELIRDIRNLVSDTIALRGEFFQRRAQAFLAAAQSPSPDKIPTQIQGLQRAAKKRPKLRSPKKQRRPRSSQA